MKKIITIIFVISIATILKKCGIGEASFASNIQKNDVSIVETKETSS